MKLISNVEVVIESQLLMTSKKVNRLTEVSMKVKRINLKVRGLTERVLPNLLHLLLMLRREVPCISKAVATLMLMELSQAIRSPSQFSLKTAC